MQAIRILVKKVEVYLILKKEKDLLENDVNYIQIVSFFKVEDLNWRRSRKTKISFRKI